MQSKKPIYKKEYETVNSVDEAIWLGNDTPVMESDFTKRKQFAFHRQVLRFCL
jgi:hypothetical protein